MIPFNKPYLTGKEVHYIYDAVSTKKISGNGKYTALCHEFFEKRYGFRKCLLTTSCTDALEMAAILIDIQPGDEVIIPSYTFVSTANPFILRGAKIIFADSEANHPNINVDSVEELISERTKAIVVVHYAGMACDLNKLSEIATKHKLFLIEDAAQAIDSFYNEKPLGSIGHLAAFSFHETKNIIAGEGGMLVINDERFVKRAEIIWEKGTNRASFFRGEVNKYGWVDIGSSFLPSEIVSAFLYAQLEKLDSIQQKRKHIWDYYFNELGGLKAKGVELPVIPKGATNNAHMFYLVCNSIDERQNLIAALKEKEIHAVFHYLSLHKSPYYEKKYEGPELLQADNYSDKLVRLPLFYELTIDELVIICESIRKFYGI